MQTQNILNPSQFIDHKTAFNWEVCTIAQKIQYLISYKRTQAVLCLIDTDILNTQIERLKMAINTSILKLVADYEKAENYINAEDLYTIASLQRKVNEI